MFNLEDVLTKTMSDKKAVKELEKRLITEEATQEDIVTYVALMFFVATNQFGDEKGMLIFKPFFETFYSEKDLETYNVKDLIEGLVYVDKKDLEKATNALTMMVGLILEAGGDNEK